jgi:Fe-S-cluster containining protein
MVFECKKTGICTRSGRCCHIRDKAIMDVKEDIEFRKAMYAKTGVIYMYPMSRYTITLTKAEKERLEKRALEKKVQLHILPKKIMFINNQIAVIDWFIDHDICPFFNETEIACTIYKDRPLVCKHFPKPYDPKLFEDTSKYDSGERMDFNEALTLCKKHFPK